MNIRDKYKELFADVAEKKYIILLAVSVFMLAFAASAVLPAPLFIKEFLHNMVKALQDMAKGLQHQPLYLVIFNIFIHNAFTLLTAMVSGAILVLLPVFGISSNGYVTGVVVLPHLSSIGLLLPHGIFEFPAFFIAMAYGIWLGLWPYGEGRVERLRQRFNTCIQVYLLLVLPLLLLAAVLEGILFNCLIT